MLTRGLLGPAISAAPALSTPPFARGDSGLPLPAEPEEALRRMERGLAGSTAPSVLRARGECCGSSHASSVCMCLCFALRPYSSGSAGSSSTSDKCFLRLLCLPIFLCLNSCKRSLSSTPACKATPPKTHTSAIAYARLECCVLTVSLVCKSLLRQAYLHCAALPVPRQQPEAHHPQAHQGSQRGRHIMRQRECALHEWGSKYVFLIHQAGAKLIQQLQLA